MVDRVGLRVAKFLRKGVEGEFAGASVGGTMPAPSPLFATLLSAFNEAGWACAEVPGREVLRAGFEAHHARVELHAQAFPELPAVSVVSESSRASTDPPRRERLAELAMRVNETLTVGNFELDWDAGRLLFRATNLFASPEGDARLIRGLVHTVVVEMDRIAPLEAMVLNAEGPALAGLDLAALLRRRDLLPEVPPPGGEAP
jgi:hypothetical protein